MKIQQNKTLVAEIIDTTVDGKGVARIEEQVFFVENAIPGDIVELYVINKKKNYFEAIVKKIIQPSKNRIEPICKHFGICGGCKWQHMEYNAQLSFKEKQVYDQLERIGKLKIKEKFPIVASPNPFYYRNKLEFTFSNRPWLIDKNDTQQQACGFHIPGRFDKVLHIEKCYLQSDLSNSIRNDLYNIAIQYHIPFYNNKEHTGIIRNVIIRNNSNNEYMVILVLTSLVQPFLDEIKTHFQNHYPSILSFYVAINKKFNDSLEDVEIQLLYGQSELKETLMGLIFNISPQSFFQVNYHQTVNLYKTILSWASLTGNEIIYDLYCGTGTISLVLARYAKYVVGIEYVQAAVEDAYNNARQNQINNVYFEAGDVNYLLNQPFINKFGKPDVIVLDPPRSGLHPDVIKKILNIQPTSIIYVSCNAATQARDVAILNNYYYIEKSQPFDMFPQTSHVENLLLLKNY